MTGASSGDRACAPDCAGNATCDRLGSLPCGMEALRVGEGKAAVALPGACGSAEAAGGNDAVAGHKYRWQEVDVICLRGGQRARVVIIPDVGIWYGGPFEVHAADLVALPMRYHGGEVPR